MIIAGIPYLVLVMCSAHVCTVNFLYIEHPEMEIVPHLCLELPVKEAYLPRPEGGTVEIDWQLLSPVTACRYCQELNVLIYGIIDWKIRYKRITCALTIVCQTKIRRIES